jgi:hypothetical protein
MLVSYVSVHLPSTKHANVKSNVAYCSLVEDYLIRLGETGNTAHIILWSVSSRIISCEQYLPGQTTDQTSSPSMQAIIRIHTLP